MCVIAQKIGHCSKNSNFVYLKITWRKCEYHLSTNPININISVSISEGYNFFIWVDVLNNAWNHLTQGKNKPGSIIIIHFPLAFPIKLFSWILFANFPNTLNTSLFVESWILFVWNRSFTHCNWKTVWKLLIQSLGNNQYLILIRNIPANRLLDVFNGQSICRMSGHKRVDYFREIKITRKYEFQLIQTYRWSNISNLSLRY